MDLLTAGLVTEGSLELGLSNRAGVNPLIVPGAKTTRAVGSLPYQSDFHDDNEIPEAANFTNSKS